MPTAQEFRNSIDEAVGGIMEFPADTKVDIMKHLAEAKRRARAERNRCIGMISVKWREGFKSLKAENDQMQKDLRAAFASVELDLNGEAGDQISALKK